MINFDVVNDVPTTNKTVFLLTDLNVPIDENGVIVNDEKIKTAMPTINYLINTGARVVIATHLGHPAGQFEARFSTKPIAKYLDDRLPCDVRFCDDCIGEKSRREIFRTEYGDVIILENLLFYREENDCDMNFARQLAEGINVYVNDAFGYCGTSFASVLGVPLFVRATAGLVLTNEIASIDTFFSSANRFTTAIIGGSRFSEKYDLMDKLVEKTKCLVVGGCVANTVLSSNGKNIGKSVYEPSLRDKAQDLLEKASKYECLVIVPQDVLVTKDINSSENLQQKLVDDIDNDDIIVDIGEQTIKTICNIIDLSRCVFWNGTLGISEFKQYRFSMTSLFNKISFLTRKRRLFSLVSGNDTILSLKQNTDLSKISFVAENYNSTYQYMCDKVLPGIEILKRLSKQLA